MCSQSSVVKLLDRIQLPKGRSTVAPSSSFLRANAAECIPAPLPADLEAWLHVVNGANIGPGGVFGVGVRDKSCSMEEMVAGYPEWRIRQWWPIAGDGCGNFYVLVPEDGRHSVYFIATIVGPEQLCYAAASSLRPFPWFLFKDDLGETTWPFDKDEVLKHDPDILKCKLAPLPWEAD